MAVRKRIGRAECRYWTHWHLTPRGWVPGIWATPSTQDLSVSPPEERVLTYEYCEYALGTSEPRISINRRVWVGADYMKVLHLLERFGEAPERLFTPRPVGPPVKFGRFGRYDDRRREHPLGR